MSSDQPTFGQSPSTPEVSEATRGGTGAGQPAIPVRADAAHPESATLEAGGVVTPVSVSPARWAAAAPMAIIGILCIIAGGLLPAVTASVITRELAWLSAYLVLITGLAAVALGFGQAFLGAKTPAGWLIYTEVVAFFAGSALVMAGRMANFPILTYVGGLILIVSLLGFLWGARGTRKPYGWGLYVYRAVIVILFISIPIGLLLTFLRTTGS